MPPAKKQVLRNTMTPLPLPTPAAQSFIAQTDHDNDLLLREMKDGRVRPAITHCKHGALPVCYETGPTAFAGSLMHGFTYIT